MGFPGIVLSGQFSLRSLSAQFLGAGGGGGGGIESIALMKCNSLMGFDAPFAARYYCTVPYP